MTDELIRTERILAHARVVLALTSLLALYLDPDKPFRHATLVYVLVLAYCAHAISLLVLVHLRDQIASSAAWAIHAVDVLWPGIIVFFTNGPSSPFFLFFIFALLGAAFRWGRFQALLTAVCIVALVAAETILLTHRTLALLPGVTFDVKFFILRTTYVAIFAVLIGYLSESEKRRREQAMAIARISARARVDAGLKGTLHAAFQQILDIFGAQEVMLIAGKAGAPPAHSWRMEILPGMAEPVFTDRDIDSSEEKKYAVVLPESCSAAAWLKGNISGACCLRSDGRRLRRENARLSADFVADHEFGKLLVSTVSAGPDLSGTLFLFWGLLNVAVWLYLPYLLRPYARSPQSDLSYLALWLLFPPLGIALYQGQSSLLLVLVFALAFVNLKRGNEFGAGLWLGLGLFKFQFVLPLILIFLLRRKWKVIRGFAMMAAGLAVLSFAAVGLSGITDYVRLMLNVAGHAHNFSYGKATDMATLQAFCNTVLGTVLNASIIHLIVAAASAGMIVLAARKLQNGPLDESFDRFFALSIVVALATGIHMFAHDMSPLALAIFLVLPYLAGSSARGWSVVTWVCIVLFWLPPPYFLAIARHALYLWFPLVALLAMAIAQMRVSNRPVLVRSAS